jgi:hypothetical protein
VKKIFTYIVYIFAFIGFSLVSVYFAIQLGLTKEKGLVDKQRNTFTENTIKNALPADVKDIKKETLNPTWTRTEEWRALKQAILKDKAVITKAAHTVHIDPRLIVAIVTVEQLRLFTDSRELFKTVFAPLKILGVQSQYSWGVVGIKRETAIAIENNLKDTTSPYYLGKEYEHLLDFKTVDTEQERFDRLTDQHNRYYSYLYTAVLIKQLERQWENAGFPIHDNPAIIATLFNIGFKRSNPNSDPKSGGAPITINGTTYSFGSLAESFYNSEELLDSFSR